MLGNDTQCKVISSGNITLFEDGFHAIPENFVINVLASFLILVIFCWMKKIAWAGQNEMYNMYKDGWITLLFRDVYDLLPVTELKNFRYVHKPLDRDMSFCQMIRHSFFKLTDEEIMERCGVDASQYLRFLKCTIVYNVVNSVLVLLFILPANYQGRMQKDRSPFVRTTMGNLDFRNSDFIWIHMSVSFFLMIFCIFNIRSFSSGLIAYQSSPWSERSVLLRDTGKRKITSERIEKYFKDILPSAEIVDIKLVYKYKHLIAFNKLLKEAEDALEICQLISRTEGREVYVKQNCWCCHFWGHLPCEACMVDGITYYSKKADSMKKLVAKEINRLPMKILRIAYVTFRNEHFAHMARKSTSVAYPHITDHRYWEIVEAHDPENIIWENLNRRGSNFTCKTLCINTAVFFIAVFLTTPTIILSSFDIMQLTRHGSVLFIFVTTVLVWILSVAIPALVTYSSGFLDFETKSGMNRSIMLKTVTFLIFTVVLLPSLGLTSISAFFIWIAKSDRDNKWGCIFLPDNGAFFVSYVMTAAFIGNIIQLLHLPEIFLCGIGVLTGKSEAEKIPIRRSSIWDFSYGVQYAHGLLIFTLVLFYSLLCPVIAPFGLAYFMLKFAVDRYNICYACSPSRTSNRVHALAIQFMMFALIMKFVGLFFFMYIRGGGWGTLSYLSLVMLLLTVSICFISMDACHWNFIPKCLLMPHKIHFKTYPDRQEQATAESEIFQPYAFRKYISFISTLDKYGNMVTTSIDSSLIESDEEDEDAYQLLSSSE